MNEKIQKIKENSHKLLAAYAAVFAFTFTNITSCFLLLLTMLFGAITFYTHLWVFPQQLEKTRDQLKRLYSHFPKVFHNAHGGIASISEQDGGDTFFIILGAILIILTIVFLIAMFIKASAHSFLLWLIFSGPSCMYG